MSRPAGKLLSISNRMLRGLERFTKTSETLDPAGLVTAARALTGLHDLGGEDCLSRLARLTESLEDEASLNPMGRQITRTRLQGILVNRLLMQADREKYPAIREERIRAPLFIAGAPRTGTSILFHTLAQDPDTLSPLQWALDFPSPPPQGEIDHSRVRKTRHREFLLRYLLPELRKVFTVDSQLPNECVVLQAQEFTSLMFSVAYRVPTYENWLLECDTSASYRTHRRILQHLQWGSSRSSWVLKSPAHLLALDSLFETYPDARVVQTHRDPLDVIASFASLTCILRSLCSEKVDPAEVGASVASFWSKALMRAAEFRASRPDLEDRFIDVEFDSICDDLMKVIRRIYLEQEREPTPQAASQMQQFIAESPRGKHGPHRYALKDFGLDVDAESKRFAWYREARGYASV